MTQLLCVHEQMRHMAFDEHREFGKRSFSNLRIRE